MKAKYVLLLTLVAAVLGFYCSAQFFDVIPQPIRDLLSWIDKNTTALLLTVCFLAGCAVLVKVVGARKIVKILKENEFPSSLSVYKSINRVHENRGLCWSSGDISTVDGDTSPRPFSCCFA